MLMRFDFLCTECSSKEEQWVDSSETLSTCTLCGHTSKRVISPIPTKFNGVGWPDADDRWARDHEKAAKKPLP